MRTVQSRRLPRRLSIDQAFPESVELENPIIGNDLKRHAAELGRAIRNWVEPVSVHHEASRPRPGPSVP